MRRKMLLVVLSCVTVMAAAMPASATSIFLSDTTSPTHAETFSIDITGGGSGSLGIWVVPDAAQTLNGVDLNLRVANSGGTAISLTGATVHNPANTASQRWFADTNVTSGTGVDSVTAVLISGMIGATTTGTGAAGEGTGINDTNSNTDPGFDAGTGAYLFATVDYDFFDVGATADLFLQIGSDGIADTSGLVGSVVFGLADADLNASILAQRGVDQTGTGQDIADADTSVTAAFDLCDANHDSVCNAADLDFIASEFGNAPTLGADVDGDGVVSRIDVTTLVTNPLGPTGFGTLYGDANLDGSVDFVDFNIFLSAGALIGPDWANADWNGDASVDFVDFNIFLSTIPPTDPAPASASAAGVPEPSTMIMLLAGLIGLALHRRN